MNQHGTRRLTRDDSPIQPSNGARPKKSKEHFETPAESTLPLELGEVLVGLGMGSENPLPKAVRELAMWSLRHLGEPAASR